MSIILQVHFELRVCDQWAPMGDYEDNDALLVKAYKVTDFELYSEILTLRSIVLAVGNSWAVTLGCIAVYERSCTADKAWNEYNYGSIQDA